MRIVTFLFLFSLSVNAFGYSLFTHAEMTEQAIKEFNLCLSGDETQPLNGEPARLLIGASAMEDFEPIAKGLHMHFYHPDRQLGLPYSGVFSGFLGRAFEIIGGQGSFVLRFKKFESELDQLFLNLPEDRPVFGPSFFGGSLVHYIQDVTNPAHVAPVFHAAGDAFDNFPFPKDWPKVTSNRCKELRESESDSLFALMDAYATDTLSVLETEFDYQKKSADKWTTQRVKWSEGFWRSEKS